MKYINNININIPDKITSENAITLLETGLYNFVIMYNIING